MKAIAIRRALNWVRLGWSPTISVDARGELCWVCVRCNRIHPFEDGECPPSDCDAAAVCLADALMAGARSDVGVFMAIESIVQEVAEPRHGRTLAEWEARSSQTVVVKVLERALLRAIAMERNGDAQ